MWRPLACVCLCVCAHVCRQAVELIKYVCIRLKSSPETLPAVSAMMSIDISDERKYTVEDWDNGVYVAYFITRALLFFVLNVSRLFDLFHSDAASGRCRHQHVSAFCCPASSRPGKRNSQFPYFEIPLALSQVSVLHCISVLRWDAGAEVQARGNQL